MQWVPQREVVGWHSQLCSQMPGTDLCSVLRSRTGSPCCRWDSVPGKASPCTFFVSLWRQNDGLLAFHSGKSVSLLTLPVKMLLLVQTFQICHWGLRLWLGDAQVNRKTEMYLLLVHQEPGIWLWMGDWRSRNTLLCEHIPLHVIYLPMGAGFLQPPGRWIQSPFTDCSHWQSRSPTPAPLQWPGCWERAGFEQIVLCGMLFGFTRVAYISGKDRVLTSWWPELRQNSFIDSSCAPVSWLFPKVPSVWK